MRIHPRYAERMIVSRTHTCKRCNSTDVTWVQSVKGKWYLIEVFDYEGTDRAEKTDFHSKYCGKPELHTAEQSRINARMRGEAEEREADAERREAERVADEAAKLEAWYAMLPAERDAHIAKLRAEIKRTMDGVTMDYMDDFLKSTAHAAALQAEIDMYLTDEED